MKKQFAQLLQGYINASGVKRVHIASVAGISYNYLSRLLAGTRKPSDQVVHKLAQALHLTGEQTSELLSAAGFIPFPLLVSNSDDKGQEIYDPVSSNILNEERSQVNRLTQQFYRLILETPETLQPSLLEEMRCLLNYARFKYLLNGGTPSLDLSLNHVEAVFPETQSMYDKQAHLDMIAQIVGELCIDSDEPVEKTSHVAEDTLFTIDHLIGNLFSGEISAANYHPQLVTQVLDMLRTGTPWEIRRRIAEALPSLSRLDVAGAEHLMEALRMDLDEIRGPDIRRRVVEALPALFDVVPQSLPTVVKLLKPHTDDDIYVAMATIEACGDIQIKLKLLLAQKEEGNEPDIRSTIHEWLPEITRIQRQILMNRANEEQESLQFSMALHNLLPIPDTLLISLEEGLYSKETLIQLVTARYLERILPERPIKTLQLYQKLLQMDCAKNVRRAVAKAVPSLLQVLKDASLTARTLARSVILTLLDEQDILFHRAVADHITEIFSIDREFLLLLLQRMHKDKDQAIRSRLRPVALHLAQVWLTWYAETAKLVNLPKKGCSQVSKPLFGE